MAKNGLILYPLLEFLFTLAKNFGKCFFYFLIFAYYLLHFHNIFINSELRLSLHLICKFKKLVMKIFWLSLGHYLCPDCFRVGIVIFMLFILSVDVIFLCYCDFTDNLPTRYDEFFLLLKWLSDRKLCCIVSQVQ